ncbi:MAG: hypothetical protein ACRDH2_20945, partial [Anaerolineales bacterium]
MSEDQTRPSRPERPPEDKPPGGGVGADAGRDVNVSGNVVGRNLTTHTTAGRDVVGRDSVQTTHVGFNATAVQKLLVTVGVMVFVTALVFFSGGLVVGAVAFNALNRPVNSLDQSAAARFQLNLQQLQALPPGQRFEFHFTEEEISSYFRLVLAPQMGVSDGKVRLLDEPGQLVVSGKLDRYGGLPFVVTFELQDTPGAPLQFKAGAVQVLRLGNSRFGWVATPKWVLQSLANDLNKLLG